MKGLFRKRNISKELRNNILNEKIDLGNIMKSAFHAKPLYDELKVKYHPDRFCNEEMKEKADKLFQQITGNKENYEILLRLKEQAEQELMRIDQKILMWWVTGFIITI